MEPSAQQSVSAASFEQPCGLAMPGASCSLPNRASMAPTMHSFNTSGGKPYSAP